MRYEIVVDHGETANKCTIAPLRDRADFQLNYVQGAEKLPKFNAPILLHHEGKCLTELRQSVAQSGIAAVDCVWRRLDILLERIEGPLPVFGRIPEGFETAYPRKSAYFEDPPGGLATIEAIFVAAALLGNWDSSLLSRYYFGRKFIEMNRSRFLELGLSEASDESKLPVLIERPRSAMQRKVDRSRSLSRVY
jgi:pre-rRNA-processing protein TSR3